jgi:hypothetical protein
MPAAPLNLYISHAPEDRPQLIKLLRWLRPLEQQYQLKVWYNQPLPPPQPMPLSWRLLLFWFTPPGQQWYPWHPAIDSRVAKAHIFLFLTSYKSLSTPWIDEREIAPAVQRYTRLGPSRVRIFPVILSPSLWQQQSRLSAFHPLGPERPLSAYATEEEAYLVLMEQLEMVVQELQRNQAERQFLTGRPVETEQQADHPDEAFLPEGDDFSSHDPGQQRSPEFPLPGWVGWTLILLIAALTFSSVFPFLPVKKYRPRQAEPELLPEPEYPRENPIYPPPTEVPPRDSVEEIPTYDIDGIEDEAPGG